ncbi:SDR family oxidoreductase [Micromonospora sp. RTGN7]|uniref:SDR family NAD(P)-dependent oxidoreductase n=1 Tax=Micromonospora sp. RTGN7 TaxID=3016526 RepID=UPI0029FF12A8|nr:SDR family oxidoreductase [Micromonospora sp. RTGN7]
MTPRGRGDSTSGIEPTGLAGKVAIVTGGGSRGDGVGIGRATAILLARRGARVVVVDSVREWAEATVGLIEAEGGEAVVVEADVTSSPSCAALTRTILELWGRIDILVNNVGVVGPPGDVVDVDLDDWDRCLRVNLSSMVLMSRHCVPVMRSGGGGSIVNTASVAGLVGGHPSIAYPTTKGAVVQLTRAMAAQHGPEGIRVNAVAPGLVWTPMVSSTGVSEQDRERRRHRSLLRTEGTGWDVGEAIAFLAGDRSRWITGVVLPVDAGATAGLGVTSGHLTGVAADAGPAAGAVDGSPLKG